MRRHTRVRWWNTCTWWVSIIRRMKGVTIRARRVRHRRTLLVLTQQLQDVEFHRDEDV